MSRYAQQMGALQVALEHRFYVGFFCFCCCVLMIASLMMMWLLLMILG
jgi:hypothetical protein